MYSIYIHIYSDAMAMFNVSAMAMFNVSNSAHVRVMAMFNVSNSAWHANSLVHMRTFINEATITALR